MLSKFIDFNKKKIEKKYFDIQKIEIELDFDKILDMELKDSNKLMQEKFKKELNENNLDFTKPIYFSLNLKTNLTTTEFDYEWTLSNLVEVITTEEVINNYMYIPLYMKNKVNGNALTLNKLGNFKTNISILQFILLENGKEVERLVK